MSEENNETMEAALLKAILFRLGDVSTALAGITGILGAMADTNAAMAANMKIALDEASAERLGSILTHDPKRVAEVIAQNEADLRATQAAATR